MKKLENAINLCFAILITTAIYFIFGIDLKYILLIFLVVYPWKIYGDIYSLFGGINTDGSVYSFFAIFQIAEKNAFCIISLLSFQKAGNDVSCIVGVSAFQKSDNYALHEIGISFYQESCKTYFGLGISVCQKALKEATAIVCVSLYQKHRYSGSHQVIVYKTGEEGGDFDYCYEEKNYAVVYVGLSFYQSAAENATVGVGLSVYQKGKDTELGAGVSIIQKAIQCASINIGISGYQKGKDTAFGGGILIIQNADTDASIYFAISFCQIAESNASINIGVSFFQNGEFQSTINLGVSFYQKGTFYSTIDTGVAIYQTAGVKVECTVGIVLFQKASEKTTIKIGLGLLQRVISCKNTSLANCFKGFSICQKLTEYNPYSVGKENNKITFHWF